MGATGTMGIICIGCGTTLANQTGFVRVKGVGLNCQACHNTEGWRQLQGFKDGSTISPIRLRNRVELMRVLQNDSLLIIVVKHWQPHLAGTQRRPKKLRNSGKRGIQTNGYWFDGFDHNGKSCEMWAGIPPAKDLHFNEDGTVTFYPNTEKSWTLAFA